jgi:hypothetical protein
MKFSGEYCVHASNLCHAGLQRINRALRALRGTGDPVALPQCYHPITAEETSAVVFQWCAPLARRIPKLMERSAALARALQSLWPEKHPHHTGTGSNRIPIPPATCGGITLLAFCALRIRLT